MKTCSCCHAPGRNIKGCSCRNGKTHVCTNDVARTQHIAIVAVIITPNPPSVDIFSIAAINTDYSNRIPVVNSPSKLSKEMSSYVANDLQFPALLCLTEWSSKKTASSFKNELNAAIGEPNRYEQLVEKLNYDHISILWDTQLWKITSFKSGIKDTAQCIVSAAGHYMAIRLQTTGAKTMDIFLFAVHFPKKSKPTTAAELLLNAIVELTRENEVRHVAIIGDFNIEFKTNIHKLFPGYTALFSGKPTTKKGSCIDNVLVNKDLASHLDNHVPVIHSACPLFTHHPIHIHR